MVTILLRRDTQHDWERANPVLAHGEPGYEVDTGKLKVGNGTSRWLDLSYFVPGSFANPDQIPLSEQDLIDHVDSTLPHPIYDDGPSLVLLYNNTKV